MCPVHRFKGAPLEASGKPVSRDFERCALDGRHTPSALWKKLLCALWRKTTRGYLPAVSVKRDGPHLSRCPSWPSVRPRAEWSLEPKLRKHLWCLPDASKNGFNHKLAKGLNVRERPLANSCGLLSIDMRSIETFPHFTCITCLLGYLFLHLLASVSQAAEFRIGSRVNSHLKPLVSRSISSSIRNKKLLSLQRFLCSSSDLRPFWPNWRQAAHVSLIHHFQGHPPNDSHSGRHPCRSHACSAHGCPRQSTCTTDSCTFASSTPVLRVGQTPQDNKTLKEREQQTFLKDEGRPFFLQRLYAVAQIWFYSRWVCFELAGPWTCMT